MLDDMKFEFSDRALILKVEEVPSIVTPRVIVYCGSRWLGFSRYLYYCVNDESDTHLPSFFCSNFLRFLVSPCSALVSL